VVAVNDAGRAAGISANTLVRVASEVLGGRGGGKDDVAQGGGADAARAGDALSAIRHALANRSTGG
jgi:alanyl-tRNA synthetase